jgi:hypothetical protein
VLMLSSGLCLLPLGDCVGVRKRFVIRMGSDGYSWLWESRGLGANLRQQWWSLKTPPSRASFSSTK